MKPIEVAREYHARGLQVLPTGVGRKTPTINWKKWQVERAAPRQLEQWFTSARVGFFLICGKVSGLCVLDCDSEAAVIWWRNVLGPILDRTTCVRTSKGWHFYFLLPPGEAGEGIRGRSFHEGELQWDFRCEGGGVVMPPSVHASGAVYEWVEGRGLDALEVAPEVLLRGEPEGGAAGAGGTAAGSGGTRSMLVKLLANPPAEGGRNDWLTMVAGHYAKQCAGKRDLYEFQVRQQAARLAPPLPDAELAKTLESIWTLEQRKTRFDPDRPDSEALGMLANRRRRLWVDGVIAQERAATWVEPPSTLDLTAELLLTDEPLRYTVAVLHPAGGNTLLAAQFKGGKTTLYTDLARCLVDREPFLGELAVDPPDGRVAMWNYEVNRDQYRVWLREAGFRNTDRVSVLNLRGYPTPWLGPHFVEWAVAWLSERQVTVWFIDPWARAISGSARENDNDEVGAVLDVLDTVKLRAGVADLFVAAHTGRKEHDEGTEHVRGATRLDDWCDSRWLLTEDHGRRFLRADGRDVEMPERALEYDPATRRLTFGGGSRESAREDQEEFNIGFAAMRIRKLLAQEPGLGSKEIRDRLKGARNPDKSAALKRLVDDGEVRIEKVGNRSNHYLVERQQELGS